MRMLIEAVKGMEVDDLDGVKVFEEQGLGAGDPRPRRAVLPPLGRGSARGRIPSSLETKYRDMLDEIVNETDSGA